MSKYWSPLEDVYGDVSSGVLLRKRFFARQQKEGETLSQYANGLQELMTTKRRKEEMGPTSFTKAELEVPDQFLLGIRGQPLRRTLWER